MKRLLSALLAFATFLSIIPVALAAPASVAQAGKTVSVAGGTRSVTALSVDLTDPNIRLISVHANDLIGQTASLKCIAAQLEGEDYEVIAAINGTFFDAYVSGPKRGMGTVISQSEMLYKLDGTFIGFGLDGEVKMDWVHIECIGFVGGVLNNTKSFYIHNWNRVLPSTSSYREAILTPAFGATTGETDMNVLVVRNDVITSMSKGETEIPKDGFVYVYPDNSAYNDGRFVVGECFEYERVMYGKDRQALNWSSMANITGVGPSLVKNGSKTADAAAEGWTDVKLTTSAAQRSFIGFDESGTKLIMGTVGNCTISQLGDVAIAYGLHNAMNLDGGASSGLLYDGKYLTTPGRDLSNAIVVVRVKNREMSTWAETAVARSLSYRIVPETLMGNYTDEITRAEYCAVIMQMLQRKTLKGKQQLVESSGGVIDPNYFTDISDYSDAILAAYAMGIVQGTGSNLFSPNSTITRAEAAVMLARVIERFADASGIEAAQFADADAIPDWAIEGVRITSGFGVMIGDHNTNFSPSGKLTRQQCLTAVMNLFDKLDRNYVPPKE